MAGLTLRRAWLFDPMWLRGAGPEAEVVGWVVGV